MVVLTYQIIALSSLVLNLSLALCAQFEPSQLLASLITVSICYLPVVFTVFPKVQTLPGVMFVQHVHAQYQ